MARKRQTPGGDSPHDHSYKRLFSDPQMVADLLRGYVRQPWVEQLGFSTLTRSSENHITPDLRERDNDIIWRVKWADQDRWLYIYLLIEFQSTPDPFMALRIMTYLGLFYEDLIASRRLKAGDKLPPVLPLVLYNGKRRWKAATDISMLIEQAPEGLHFYRPELRYLLLDESTYAGDPLPATRNLVAALFGLENSRTPDDVREVLRCLIDWLELPEQMTLRQNFTLWLKRVMLPARMDGMVIPPKNSGDQK